MYKEVIYIKGFRVKSVVENFLHFLKMDVLQMKVIHLLNTDDRFENLSKIIIMSANSSRAQDVLEYENYMND